MLSQARIIAKGNRIRDVQRLVGRYGGRASDWVKKSSQQFELDGEWFEYHWYQRRGGRRVEERLVPVKSK
jgi:hypothetical protein